MKWPDWCDAGKTVEIVTKSEIIRGTLAIEDFGSDGEGWEYPIFSVLSIDGVEHSFANADSWRFV